jgi:hypothetical protein
LEVRVEFATSIDFTELLLPQDLAAKLLCALTLEVSNWTITLYVSRGPFRIRRDEKIVMGPELGTATEADRVEMSRAVRGMSDAANYKLALTGGANHCGTPSRLQSDETLRVLGFPLGAAGETTPRFHYAPRSEPQCKDFTAWEKRGRDQVLGPTPPSLAPHGGWQPAAADNLFTPAARKLQSRRAQPGRFWRRRRCRIGIT